MMPEAETINRRILLDKRPVGAPSVECFRFDTADVARVRLICDLHYELRIEEDSVPVVLSLMDQLYAARRDLRALAAAVSAQPESVREAIAERVKLVP